jgi:hypothetical protein
VCEIVCAAIFKIDLTNCACVPLDSELIKIEIIGKTKDFTPGRGPIGPVKMD